MFTYTHNEPYQAYLEAMGYIVTSSLSECNRKGRSILHKERTTPEGFTQVLTLKSHHTSARNDHDFSSSSYYEYLNIPKGATVDLEELSWDLFNKFELVCGPLADQVWSDIRRMNYEDKPFFDYPQYLNSDNLYDIIDGVPHYYICKYSKDTNRLTTVDQEIAKHKAQLEETRAKYAKRAQLTARVRSEYAIPAGSTIIADLEWDGSEYYQVSCDNGFGHGNTPQEAIEAHRLSKLQNIEDKKAKIKELERKLASYPTSKDILMDLRSMHMPYADGMRQLASNTGWSVDTLWDIFKGKYENELPWEAQCLKTRIEDLRKELNNE